MRTTSLMAALVAFAVHIDPVSAGDLAKIDRTIAKEPAYRSKPTYCLLVFGPEAKKRIWLVRDGDVLYVDRKGNADLTEASNRMVGEKSPPEEPGYLRFKVGTLKEATGGPGSQTLQVMFYKDEVNYIKFEGKYRQEAPVFSKLHFASKPHEAPILHFDGPLTLAMEQSPPTFTKDEEELRIILGTPGIGCPDPGGRRPGSFVKTIVTEFPKDTYPLAEIEFAPKGKEGPPIKLKWPFRKH